MCPVYMTPEGRTWLLRHTVSPGLLVTRQHADAVPSGDTTGLPHAPGHSSPDADPRWRGGCLYSRPTRAVRETCTRATPLARGRPR